MAGLALAVGGGVAGAVVVAPALQPDAGSIAVQQAAEKEALASLQHTFHVAKKARGMARGARQLANGLVDDVNQAQSDATQALNAAGAASARLDSTKTVSGTASGTAVALASNPDFQADSAGPRVTVEVPQSGFIEVSATARIESTEGAVGLFEDGNLVPIPGQQQWCEVDDVLFALNDTGGPVAPVTLSTPPHADLVGGMCGTLGAAPVPVLLKRPPGTHTYELRYADCGCDADDAVFSNRTISVAPRL